LELTNPTAAGSLRVKLKRMNPNEKALELLNKMNGQYITLSDWHACSDYAKAELKRKALVVVDEVMSNVFKSDLLSYWVDVKAAIQSI